MGYADGNGDWDKSSATQSLSAVWRIAIRAAGFSETGAPSLWHKLVPDRLSLRLVLAMLLISSVLSVFATALQVYFSYSRQKTDALHVFTQVEQVMQRQLEQALWEFDFGQVEIILDGLMAHEDIAHISLLSPTGHRWVRGDTLDGALVETFELTMATSDRGVTTVGTMTVHLSLENVTSRVKQQFWVTLASNVAKAYIGAFLFLIVVHRMIIRHLRRIALHVSGAKPVEPAMRLRLSREPRYPLDALDQIVGAVHGFETRVEGYVQQLNQEMSQREDAQYKADQAAQARTQFLSNMSGDIRTPMNSILGLFQLIKDGEDVPERHKEQAEIGHRAAHHLSSQLVNILDLSRLDSQDITPTPTPTELAPLAETWLAQARMLVARRESRVAVTLTVDDAVPRDFRMDGNRVSRIMDCLIDNAVKFCDAGQISLVVRPATDLPGPDAKPVGSETPARGIEILVRDCGPAIRYEDREVIFERFTRVEDHLDRKADGAGLGLALAREMAKLLGGSLRVEDSDDKRFTNEFRVTLPESPEPA